MAGKKTKGESKQKVKKLSVEELDQLRGGAAVAAAGSVWYDFCGGGSCSTSAVASTDATLSSATKEVAPTKTTTTATKTTTSTRRG
jgi:hypothetical protein